LSSVELCALSIAFSLKLHSGFTHGAKLMYDRQNGKNNANN